MKKWVVLILTGVLLAGCSTEEGGSSQSDKKEKLPSGFTFVNKDVLNGDYITVAKHNKTGCYYTFLNGGYDTTVGATQMFVEKDGVSIPYCD